MYIEFLPIEENIQNLLSYHTPNTSVAATVLFASPQEAGETATYLHSEAHGDQFNGGIGIDELLKERSVQNSKISQAENSSLGPNISAGIDRSSKEKFHLHDTIETEGVELQNEKEHLERIKSNPKRFSKNPSCLFVEIEDKNRDFSYIIPKKSSLSITEEVSKGEKLLHLSEEIFANSWPNLIPVQPVVRTYTRTKSNLRPKKLVLNGNPSAFISASLGRLVPDDHIFESESAHRGNNTYHYEYDGQHFVEKTKEEYSSANEINWEQKNQMGIDILNKIRRFIKFNSRESTSIQEQKGKRRLEDLSLNSEKLHKFKYRKVENIFPKYIPKQVEDDDLEIMSSPHSRQRNFPAYTSSTPFENSKEMEQYRLSHSFENPKPRKSMFIPPTTTHKLIKNNSYADIEFSDDDELELRKIGSENCKPFINKMRKPIDVAGIPVSKENERSVSGYGWQSNLGEKATSNVLGSTLNDKKPTYATVLKQIHINDNADDQLISGHGSSLSGSSVSTCAREYTSYNSVRTNPWASTTRSILAQERVNDEREKYQQLLEQMMPRLYGTENKGSFITKNSFKLEEGNWRKSPIINAGPNISRNLLTEKQKYLLGRRPPLLSTISLDDEDDEDVKLVNIYRGKIAKNEYTPTVVIDDDDICEVVDLDKEPHELLTCSRVKSNAFVDLTSIEKATKQNILPFVEPVNTLQEHFNSSPHLKDDWLETWKSKWSKKKKHHLEELEETTKIAEKLAAERRIAEIEIQDKLRRFQIVDPEILVIDDFPEPIEEESDFIELTSEHEIRIKSAIYGPPDEVLISKFNLNITRRDIHTLLGHNWLNDEVINFYMSLLTERSEKKYESHGYPRAYAMNTFFVPRLMQSGHSGVKRWTRKVDLFSKDVIPVPVHVGGVHWCMAIINLKYRSIKYYDSMGTPNPNVLKALEQYLKDESMDKRKQPFDTSKFQIESVKDVPRQMNGSDCGVFSCMFAEFITRNKEITFSQQHMEYFRSKMILEIVKGELLQ